MQEVVLQVLSQVRSAWRFRWYGAAVAWVVALLGWAWVVTQPDIYEANARVYVDTSSILRPLLNNRIVPTDVTTRLQYVRQALLSREYLERIAAENGLDAAAVTPSDHEAVLSRLLRYIRITAISTRDEVSRDSSSSVFNISFRHEEPDTAVGVVTTLLNSLIEDTLGANRESTDTAERFLDDRIHEYENRLQQAEQALAEFQRANSGRLPGSEGGYFERMQREREVLEQTRRELRLAQSRRVQLEEQLTGERPVLPNDDASKLEPPPNSIDARIRDHRAELDQLLLEFTERHPDVVARRESLARLEAQRADQLRALGLAGTDQEISSLGTNPVYQAVQIALNEVRVEIATLQSDESDRQRRLAELQALIDEVPAVEAELARLNRDYDVIKEQYQALIQSRETQTLSRKASDSDQVDFRVLNPPQAGLFPVAPPRLVFITAVLFFALGAGGGLCYVLAQLRPVFSNGRGLREAVGLPVLGTVHRALVGTDTRMRRHWATLSFFAAMGGLASVFCVVVLIEVFGPGFRSILGST